MFHGYQIGESFNRLNFRLQADVGIVGGHLLAAVPQQFLHRPDADSTICCQRGEGMPEGVERISDHREHPMRVIALFDGMKPGCFQQPLGVFGDPCRIASVSLRDMRQDIRRRFGIIIDKRKQGDIEYFGDGNLNFGTGAVDGLGWRKVDDPSLHIDGMLLQKTEISTPCPGVQGQQIQTFHLFLVEQVKLIRCQRLPNLFQLRYGEWFPRFHVKRLGFQVFKWTVVTEKHTEDHLQYL